MRTDRQAHGVRMFCPVNLIYKAVVFSSALLLAGGLTLQSIPPEAFAWPPAATSSPGVSVAAVVWADWVQNVYRREHVPYFALHPPVYYTEPVGRPYGWSPFAYPAWVATPLIEPARPMVIQNPYVVGFAKGKASMGCAGTDMPESDSSVGRIPKPIRIANPYVPSSSLEAGPFVSAKGRSGAETAISSTAPVQPRRIRNPHLPE